MKKLVFVLILFTLFCTACAELPKGQARIDQLCQKRTCLQAVVLEDAPFDPDPLPGRFPDKCHYGTSSTVLAGTEVTVIKVMPENRFGAWALIAYLDANGHEVIGWLDEGYLDPNPENDLYDFCPPF